MLYRAKRTIYILLVCVEVSNFYFLCFTHNNESIWGQFCKISVLGGMLSWKIVSVLQNFELFWKIWSVLMVFLSPRKSSCALTKFWTRSPGKFDLFLWSFFLLENCMCSCGILRNLSWKFWCILVNFASPGKFTCVLVPFLVLLRPGKFDVFL